jgi:hypothetical protein
MNSLIEDLGDKSGFNSDFEDLEDLGNKSGLLQGNLLNGIEKKTIRRDFVSICFLMYSSQ